MPNITNSSDSIKKHIDAQEKTSATSTVHTNPSKDDVIEYPTVDYDVGLVDNFLAVVFGETTNPAENILTWRTKPQKPPRFPIGEEALLNQLEKVSAPYALYYATSTARSTIEDTRDGEREVLRNRKGLFERFHVLVLDDIGTKIPLDKIPETMQPSYIIESSEGNFQYGYVLETPMENIAEAEALVDIAYSSGFSDAGGKMANKLVRLPEGLNGKAGIRGTWRVQLTELNDRKWTPDALLEEMCVGFTWADVLADPELLRNRAKTKIINASKWSSTHPEYSTLTGVIDPVLEWLSDENMILNETGEWFTIRCPWGNEHSNNDDSAGYNAVGYGEDPTARGFHCFHDSCSGRKTPDFLMWVAQNSGIEADVRDFAAHLLTKYIFDSGKSEIHELLPSGRTQPMQLSAFRVMHDGSAVMNVQGADGKVRRVNAASMFLSSPSLVTFSGLTYDIENPTRVVTDEHGGRRLNRFNPPSHIAAPVDMAHVERFLSFIEYLIPDEEERDYFTQWAIAKMQNLAFKGAAIIMYTQGVQGIGRSTLLRMLERVFGRDNAAQVPFNQLVDKGGFNEWQEKPFIMVDESRTSTGNFYTNYERLKEIIDPADASVVINHKFQTPYSIKSCTSFVFLSNHVDGVGLPEDDRRFYPIANPNVPETPAFFTSLNEWLNTSDWAQHVYNWAQTQVIDLPMLHSPPPRTATKAAVIEASRDIKSHVVSLMQKELPEAFTPQQVKHVLEEVALKLGLGDALSRCWTLDLKGITVGGTGNGTIKALGRLVAPRMFVKNVTVGSEIPNVKRDLSKIPKEDRAAIRASVMRVEDRLDDIVANIVEELEILGF